MTYNDLCTEVAALGFESEIESQERLLTAARRALRMIFTERPLYDTATLYKSRITSAVKIDSLLHKGGYTDTVSYNAKAYSFKTSGVGSYKICEDGEERIYAFSGSGIVHRGFLHGEGELVFVGEYCYTVYDLRIFDEIYGASTDDIPVQSGYTEYDLSRFTQNFLSLASAPANEYGSAIPDSSVCGKIMRIPDEYSGKIHVRYKKAPSDISESSEEEIALPDGCEHLLPLLTAAFVWLDDDAEKAQYYMSLYKEAMAAVKYYERPHIDNSYHTADRWA